MKLFLRSLIVIAIVGFVAADAKDPLLPLGVATHETSDAGLDLIAGMKFGYLRQVILWEQVEVMTNGKLELKMPANYVRYVEQARKRGIKPLLILAYGNSNYEDGKPPTKPETIEAYAKYCEFVVKYFRNRVTQYEIWNEWNRSSPGKPEDYVNLLKAAYQKIKATHQRTVILGGAVGGTGVDNSDWLKRACDAGMLHWLDAVSFHPYTWSFPVGLNDPERGVAPRVAAVQSYLAKETNGKMVPLFVSEIGWPTYQGTFGISEQQQADFCARTLLVLSAMPWMKAVWWYNWRDDGLDPKDPESNFGLVHRNLSAKPAWLAATNTANFLNLDTKAPMLQANGNTRLLTFFGAAGRYYAAAWTLSGTGVVRIPGDIRLAGKKVREVNAIQGEVADTWKKDLAAKRSYLDVNASTTPTLVSPAK